VALNSAGFNVARSVGPALGGLVVAVAGSGTAFLVNGLSFLGVIWFLVHWRRRPHVDPVPGQHVWAAIKVGFQYVSHSDAVRAVLVRTGLFSLFASAIWAMLPLLTKSHGSVGYGLSLASLGAGAVVGAALIPSLRRIFSLNRLVVAASLVFGVVTFVAGQLQVLSTLCAVLFVGGMAWISILASLNLSAQTTAPSWVRARSLSMYLLILQGGMAGGGALWGALAGTIGIRNALAVAAIGLLAGLPMARTFRLGAAWVEVPPPLTQTD
jgi:hypothetical protein